MPTIYAEYLDRNGYDHQTIDARNAGLIKGKRYEVDYADIGQSSTRIDLKGFSGGFNSVMFEFYDEDGNEFDIFNTEWNPYR